MSTRVKWILLTDLLWAGSPSAAPVSNHPHTQPPASSCRSSCSQLHGRHGECPAWVPSASFLPGVSLRSRPCPSSTEDPLLLETVTFLCLAWFSYELSFPPQPHPSCTRVRFLSSVSPPESIPPFKPLPKTVLYPYHPLPFKSRVSSLPWHSELQL